MAESFLGDGLIYDDALPAAWLEGPLTEGAGLARLNADNHQLLGAESSLDEIRVHDALKEESQALVNELQRLEYKVNILLRLTAELAMRDSAMPPPQRIRMSSQALEWIGSRSPALGATGVAVLYVNTALPQPLKLPCTVVGERFETGERAAQLRFTGLSEPVIDMLQKLIFRHHRRLIAGARLAGI